MENLIDNLSKPVYNFDIVVDRKHQNSKKWTDWKCFGMEDVDPDVLPMWIADMDFACEPRILDELDLVTKWGVIGYDSEKESFYDSFIDWQMKKNGWKLEREWIVPNHGVVPAIVNAIKVLTDKGDKILIQPPVYYPFFAAIEKNERKIVRNDLINNNGRYEIDFADFEAKLKEVKLFILCSPHNPVGRVWTRDELEKIAKLCLENDVIIISDEIHSDLIFKNSKHIPIASLSADVAKNTITLTAPSKTFNIAGLAQSVAIIENEQWREKYRDSFCALGLMHMSTFGIVGFEAAYRYGENWLEQVLEYIEANVDYTVDYISKNIPCIKTAKPDGTFLMWLDLSGVTDNYEKLDKFLIDECKILMDKGERFDVKSKGFYRLNIAVPRSILEDGMERLEKLNLFK